ncbi:alpha/beta hydrolase [Burkholderia sp. Ac-20353]|uniref:alpha/beta hydrolase n=1 Tax=Burkholderia sp. Ac-20353 TaxID=2703894 RepID=UPI00197BE457|nr:alpha/beta hydrolase [Burkholderia sp. Ac-20353]MBN3788820.1 alpha/beta hydrolase [Burkholderia sp. Ac-20353]
MKIVSDALNYAGFSPEEGQRQYSTRAQIPDFEKIISRWQEDAAAYRAKAVYLDVPYGETPAERLDFFLPNGIVNALIVFIRGGYWRSLDKSMFSRFAENYTSRGAAVAVVNYGHAPEVPLSRIVDQVRSAVEWVYRNPSLTGAQKQSVTIVAHSAGAHLGAMMLATDWPSRGTDLPHDLIRGAVLVSGVYDLRPLVDLHFVNKDLSLDQTTAESLSPMLMAPAARAPLFIAAGADESEAFRGQSQAFAKNWDAIMTGYVELPGIHHLATYEEMCKEGSTLHRATLGIAGLSD